ncbi:hypothetical protein A3462_12720 [Enterobacter bugandensis]|uniref:hypothetical protein n=1 Tax=Enterobacter bugandensis TaxID=881260 RepID=UPI0007BC7FBF|nr:hypothetical protein [Enterobacter bugandensis]KZP63126.1 hypothetical protein A3462_12720 [Enterobacter bugandensis]
MKAIKIINIFKAKENFPFMTCLITSMEENEKGINLTLESGEASALKITVITYCQKLTVICTENK